MGCACKDRAKRSSGETYTITLPGGLKFTRSSKEAADRFAARHPGATVKKG